MLTDYHKKGTKDALKKESLDYFGFSMADNKELLYVILSF